MITFVDGEGVGCGKSFFATYKIAEHLARGGTCYHSETYQPRWDGMVKLVENDYGVTPKREQMVSVSEEDVWRVHEVTPPGSEDCPLLIVIDEAQGQLNARDTRDGQKRPLFDWMCQSRHDDTDLLILTQDEDNVDVQARRLGSNRIETKNFGAKKDGLATANEGFPLLGNIPFFLWRFTDRTGRRQYDWKLKYHRKLVFGAYVSKACRGRHKRATSEGVKRVQLEKAKSPMKLIVWFALGAVALGGYGTFRMFSGMTRPAAKTPPAAVVAPAKAAASPSLLSGPAATPRPAWDTVEEGWRGGDGRTFMHTDAGVYELGAMSPKGYVEGIRGYVVKIRDGFGRIVFIVGTPGKALAASPAPATPAPKTAGELAWNDRVEETARAGSAAPFAGFAEIMRHRAARVGLRREAEKPPAVAYGQPLNSKL